ncbi:MAG: hypothetical protein KC561_04435, partial [Myxococcales bacterium]|nr:hypothetical protein [Myxococcales bacterium]
DERRLSTMVVDFGLTHDNGYLSVNILAPARRSRLPLVDFEAGTLLDGWITPEYLGDVQPHISVAGFSDWPTYDDARPALGWSGSLRRTPPEDETSVLIEAGPSRL